jgi:hypothetical protein
LANNESAFATVKLIVAFVAEENVLAEKFVELAGQ